MKSIIGFFGTFILMYLLGAFVNADFNPSSWGMANRGFIASTAFVLAIAFAGALWDE